MAGTSSRGNPSMADVVRSVVVLGLLILGLWVIGRLVTVTPDEPTSTVDYAAAAQQVADAVPYAVLSPPTLPDGWRATSARLEDGRWHLGVVTKSDDYVGLEQEEKSADSLVKQFAKGSKAGGDVTIADSSWTERTSSDGVSRPGVGSWGSSATRWFRVVSTRRVRQRPPVIPSGCRGRGGGGGCRGVHRLGGLSFHRRSTG
ncbi:MAG: DUF4245 family protein [Actinomycetales bacterium]|nr:MAG: DUF4245 family protein [Actinomycetales bacterium]